MVFNEHMPATHTTTSSPQEAAMFATIQAGTLPIGTVTDFGVIARTSYTAYEMTDGEWVPFHKIHGRPAPVMPLVTLTGA
jgi:hypothetical protein